MQSLLFSSFTTIVSDVIVSNSISNLNKLPRRTTHITLSPNTFVIGDPKPYFNLMKLEFGDYVEVHEDHSYQTNPHTSRYNIQHD